ncbi:ribonuclease E inhibitor RraB [Asticcacaulis sp.]|uniref:ribonuclease E inhibitor RraB n=1 Tax=Asticcacaulis sp. TaxID=1872648 RepID=UPI002CCD54D6|nr:ribonuclease E inhibitor RraB [Asticcacaulis sp.]HTM80963.1 ribonuclease E inhibitor RraB [Asticcacaulis sp.]
MPIDFPADENGDVLRSMQADGDDLSVARDIDFSLLFPDEESAKTFCVIFAEKGYEVDYGPWEIDHDNVTDLNFGKWNVQVVHHMAPDHAAITAFEGELQDAATPLGGRNDGWGCFQVNEG